MKCMLFTILINFNKRHHTNQNFNKRLPDLEPNFCKCDASCLVHEIKINGANMCIRRASQNWFIHNGDSMVHSCAGLPWVYQTYLNHLKPIGHLRLCGRQTTCKDIMTWPKRWPSRVLSVDLDFLSLSSPCTRQIVAFQGWLLVQKTNVRDWKSLEKGAQKALAKLELQEDKTKIGHIMTLLQTICPCWDLFVYKTDLMQPSSYFAETHLFASHFSHLFSLRTSGFLDMARCLERTNPAPFPEMMAGWNL